MTLSVRDARASSADRAWIQQVYRDYLDDLAPVHAGTGLFPSLGEVGHREPDQLARWYGDKTALPLIICDGNEPVGFAMVARGAGAQAGREAGGGRASPGRAVDYRMAEFFIARPHRRRGVGSRAVQLIFRRFTGHWEITEYVRNSAAVGFWRRVVSAYTGGAYQERIVNDEVRQRFESKPARPGPDKPRSPR